MRVLSYFNSSVKIADNIWQVGGSDITGPGDAAIYLVRDGGHAAVIDAGCGHGHDRLVENIDGCISENVKIVYLMLTHCHFDHTGGAQKLRERYGLKIVAHARDAVYLERGDSDVTAAGWYGCQMEPFSVDLKITEKEKWIELGEGGIRAYHCPGHSPGSLVFLMEAEGKKVLFGQDIHGPLHSSLLSNREDYLDSLRFIMDLNVDILCEGHFGVFKGKNKVRRFVGSYLV